MLSSDWHDDRIMNFFSDVKRRYNNCATKSLLGVFSSSFGLSTDLPLLPLLCLPARFLRDETLVSKWRHEIQSCPVNLKIAQVVCSAVI